MDTLTAVVTIISVVTAQAGALLALWLRLRWQLRHARVQGRHLVRLAEVAAGEGRLQLVEKHGKSHHVTINLTFSTRADAAP
jgi:hypothetical protein